MTQKIKISIIIPLFNKESCIRNTVNRILEQPYRNIEVIVVDDGSTDGSLKMLENLTDERLRVITKDNGGPASARNLGVKLATTQWIYFIDADDIMASDTLLRFADLISQNPSINVFVANYFMKKGEIFKHHTIYMHEGVVSNNFCSWFWEILSPCQGATLYKKTVLEKYPYPEHLRRWEDAAMFFDVMRNEKIYLSDFPSFTYILDNSSASHGRKNIDEDFLGHLDLKKKKFWERMSYMFLLDQAKMIYPEEINELYGNHPTSFFDNVLFFVFCQIKYGMRIVAKIINIILQPHE